MSWSRIIEKVRPFVVRVETPGGRGTGMVYSYDAKKEAMVIATAWHVVSVAVWNAQPITIVHPPSGQSAEFKPGERLIFTPEGQVHKTGSDAISGGHSNDLAVIVVESRINTAPLAIRLLGKGLDHRPPPLLDAPASLDPGDEIGWLGFPGLPNDVKIENACFFAGRVSAPLASGYLIDGVAVPGVSGGPVFRASPADGIQFVGIITAYAHGQNGLGLCVAEDVSVFHRWRIDKPAPIPGA